MREIYFLRKKADGLYLTNYRDFGPFKKARVYNLKNHAVLSLREILTTENFKDYEEEDFELVASVLEEPK